MNPVLRIVSLFDYVRIHNTLEISGTRLFRQDRRNNVHDKLSLPVHSGRLY